MSKFNKLYNLIMESYLNQGTENIPRPDRLKTPPNNYGNTGHNAKYFDMYVQDEAESIYQNKYGTEKGTKLWEGIIYKGNAMWTACDEILGELRTMQDINSEFIGYNKYLNQCTDFNSYYDSYIVQWVQWILITMIQGKHYTNDFISTCIPTFKAVLKIKPMTIGFLLQQAGIDVETYQLSKKIKARRDAEEQERQRIEQERLERQRKEEEFYKRKVEAEEKTEKICNVIGKQWFTKIVGQLLNPDDIDYQWLDLTKDLNDYVTLPQPTTKDEQRIYDIIKKASYTYTPPNNPTGRRGYHYTKSGNISYTHIQHNIFKGGLANVNIRKAIELAEDMNNKITSDSKRQARKAAAEKYGLLFIANCFK